MIQSYKKVAEEILNLAGIKVDGNNPWDIQIHNDQFYKRVITKGHLGLGESYMDGWWDAECVDQFICKILEAKLYNKIKMTFLVSYIKARLFNVQSPQKAFIIGRRHYDLGNVLFENMLDKRLNYSCAYWGNATDIDTAQENKLELICKKLYLQPGMRILDIGCGWGGFAKYAAEKHNAEVVGITVSKEQYALGKQLCSGLPVELRLMDYRSINEKFDRIISVGMIEHVGYKNYKDFFHVAERNLKDEGLFLLHTIGGNKSVKSNDPWIEKYIFPNSMLPSIAQLSKNVENLFVIEDVHSLGVDYDKTLMAWFSNFNSNWGKLKKLYDGRFYRMWKYYLLSAAGAFRARYNQLWQIVFSKNGVEGGYQAVR
jgi:cyclopropane-fatty-acyl-phospholipid synthase